MEIEENYEPTAEELESLTKQEPEPMIPMESEEPKESHAVEFDENGKLKFNAGGQEIEADKDQLIKYAQQGYGATNKIGELNKQIEELKSQGTQVPDEYEQYKQIDEWAKANPEQWDAIRQGYSQQTEAPTETLPENLQQAIAPIMEELQGLRQFKESLEAQQHEQKVQAEDLALDQEIKGIREAHTDLDFDTPGEDGLSLEYKVLKHAADNGITSFKTAFRDYNHERLIQLAEERGKEAVIQERRARNKLGLLETAPSKDETYDPDYDPRKASDKDNFLAALAELKQA